MWYVLRTELVYFRPWLFGGLAIAAGVSLLMSVLVWLYGDEGPPRFLIAMFPVIAGMVVSFIAQSYRIEEHRARLLMAGPLTPRQLAGVTVLLPPCLVGLGALVAGLMIGVLMLFSGESTLAGLPAIVSFTGQFLAYAQMGPLAQEATAARRQGRNRAAIAGWAVFILAIPVLAVLTWFRQLIEINANLWLLITLGLVAAATVVLFQGRTDFTR